MSTTVSTVNLLASSAAGTAVGIATVQFLGFEVQILTILSISVAILMSVATRVYANIRSKAPVRWQENMALGTITTVLSVGVTAEYNLSFLYAAAVAAGISIAGESIVAALGQGVVDILKIVIDGLKDKAKGFVSNKPKANSESTQSSPEKPAKESPKENSSADNPESDTSPETLTG